MDTTLTIRISNELKHSLEKLAKASGRTKSYLALDAIRSYLDQEAWQVAEIKKAIKEADAGDFATEAEVKRIFKKWGVNAR